VRASDIQAHSAATGWSTNAKPVAVGPVRRFIRCLEAKANSGRIAHHLASVAVSLRGPGVAGTVTLLHRGQLDGVSQRGIWTWM
jgi:hypothetical protein